MSLHGTCDTRREFPQVMTFLQSGMFSCCNILSETLLDRLIQTHSHRSNKRDVTLTDFGKFHPAQNKNPPCTFTDFLDFPPSTPRLLHLYSRFFQKIPPSTFIDFVTFAPPTRLFQPPRLLER